MGDKKNAIRKLQIASRTIKLNPILDIKEIDLGSPKEYLRLYHYLFLDYSPVIASEILTKHNMELSSKNDKLFIDGIYKLVRDMFGYVPKLSKEQFFQTSFAQIKALMAAEIIDQVQEKLKSSLSSSSTTSINATRSKILNGFNRDLIENNENIDTVSPKKNEKEQSNTHISSVQRKGSFKSTNNSLIKNLIKQPVSNQLKQVHKEHHVLKENVNDSNRLKEHDNLNDYNNSQINQYEVILSTLTDKLANLTSKFDSILDRVENIEKILADNNKQSFQNSDQLLNSKEILKLNKNIENLSNRLTIIETDLISVKQQNLFNKNLDNNSSLRQDDLNDTTAYETPFHSFVNISPKDENIYPKKSSIIQGLPCDIENVIAENFNDLTINSTDSTPTLSDDQVRVSKFKKFNEANNDEDENILRAKELVSRATQLNQILTTNLKS